MSSLGKKISPVALSGRVLGQKLLGRVREATGITNMNGIKESQSTKTLEIRIKISKKIRRDSKASMSIYVDGQALGCRDGDPRSRLGCRPTGDGEDAMGGVGVSGFSNLEPLALACGLVARHDSAIQATGLD